MEHYVDEGDPVVYIFGACWNEGHADARAGYGTNWGPNDTNNTEGALEETTINTLVAELTAMESVLILATLQNIDSLVIRHSSKKLDEELRTWENTSARDERFFPNNELWKRIDALKVQVQAWIEKAEPGVEAALKFAREGAYRAAGMHSTSLVPLNNEFWSGGVRIVHIFGATMIGKRNHLKAGYGVFWSPDDEKNEFGGVQGEQSQQRAQITAVYAALATAIDHGIDQLIVRSTWEDLGSLVNQGKKHKRNKIDAAWETHKDLTKLVVDSKSSFRVLKHEVIRQGTPSLGQRGASQLARSFGPIIRMDVLIRGTMTACGIARYGVYYNPGDTRNESGRIHGEQIELIAELTAIQRAIQIANETGVRFLTIRIPSQRAFFFMKEELNHLIAREWKTDFGETFAYASIGKKIAESTKQLKLNLLSCFVVDTARAFALANTPQYHRWKAIYTAGACYYRVDGENEAGFGVFLGADDPLNKSGPVVGLQDTTSGGLTAVLKALEIAIENGFRRITIKVDCETIYKMVGENVWNNKKNWEQEKEFKYKDLLIEIDEKAAQLDNVEYQHFVSADAEQLAQWIVRANIANILAQDFS